MAIDLEGIRDYLSQNDPSATAIDYKRTAIALLAEVERLQKDLDTLYEVVPFVRRATL